MWARPTRCCTQQVFERERLNGHYGAAAFVISNTLYALGENSQKLRFGLDKICDKLVLF